MTRGPAGRDTRKFRRVDLEVSVLVTDAARKVRKPIRFSSTDVSCGGTFLRADVLFEVGEVLLIEFDLPGGRRIRTQSRVVRVARGASKDRFPGMGLEFLDLSTDDRAALHARTS
jgi:c-di-GMP-binding flagellar brake protein YcgR